ncbi:MAG: copper resistance protein CopC, partial [Tagaea sp.]
MRAAVLAVLLCFWAGAAVAHAVLLETDPGDGARLATPPSSVSLRFNEHVAPIAARLIGPDGAIATLTPSARGYSIDVALPAALAPGGYYLAWRVASADTHPIAGTLAFSVGDGPAAVPISGTAGADAWRGAAILARAVRDVALALGVGGAAFLALVGARRSRSIYVALAAAAGATIAGAALAGARLADADPLTATAWNAALATTAGDAMVAILAGVALAALPGRVGPFAGLAAVAIGTALTGHAATAEPRWLFGTAQALHVGAAIFWLGAFWPLAAELRRAPARAGRGGGPVLGGEEDHQTEERRLARDQHGVVNRDAHAMRRGQRHAAECDERNRRHTKRRKRHPPSGGARGRAAFTWRLPPPPAPRSLVLPW